MATASSQGLSGTARLPSMTHRVRTFHGCLTCRRRKVKCDSQQSPCKTCNRLGISCTPSFPSNFKNSSLDVHPIRKGTRATQPVSDKNPPVAGNQGALQTEAGPNGSLTQQSNEVNPWISDHIPSILSYGVDDIAYDLGFQPFHMGDTPSFITADVQFQPQSFNNGSLYTTVDESSLAISSSATPATDIRCANLFPNHMDAVSPDTQHSLSPIPRISDSRRVSHWDASSQAPQAQIRDTVLIRHYESTLSTFFSVKLPQWNLYTYMLRSQEKSNSPLWNSIMAWTSLHLARRDMNPTRKSAMYYDNASDAVQRLLKELSIEAQSPALVSKSTSSAEQLYMVLSTTFFLSHCNVMICDRHAFSERLDALKLVLRRNWETVHGKLGSLASRLLIWLAYLDLRASLWGDPGSTDQTANHNPGLLDMLDDFNALPSLRSVSENQSYLSECFGDNYPSTELREDLVQEPVNATSDDIMCILSRIKAFEAWNDEMIKRGAYEEDADVRELRATRAQALRDEIACIRAVCLKSPLFKLFLKGCYANIRSRN